LFQCDIIIIITTTYDYGEHVGLDSQEVVFYDYVVWMRKVWYCMHALKDAICIGGTINGAKKMHQNMNWD